MFSVLSFGEVLVDFLPESSANESYKPLAGGAPANVSVAFAKLGGKSFFAGGVSQDNFGVMLLDKLKNFGVDTRYVKVVENSNTAVVLVSLDEAGERSFNFYRHNTADTQYLKSDVEAVNWQETGVFHYCSNTLTDRAMTESTQAALTNAKGHQVLISFDVNLRQQLWPNLSQLPTRVDACIEQSDLVKLSKDEAEYLAQQKQLTLSEYIDHLQHVNVNLVVITDGPNPIQLIGREFNLYVDVPKISALDTTAAGDSFIAGLLFSITEHAREHNTTLLAVLNNPKWMSEATQFGSKCGAFTCQSKGAFDALPLLNDLAQLG